MLFNSQMKIVGDFKHDWTQEQVKNEPMLFNCDVKFAYKNGGPITKEFIKNIPQDWQRDDLVIDSRVHMLMPGWYPCIGGWHQDDVPRTTPTGQPNHLDTQNVAEHLMGLVNGDICPTEFINDVVNVSNPDINTTIFEVWDKEISAKDFYIIKKARSGVYIEFNSSTFHRGTEAVGNGWRWFIRVSRKTTRTQRITNEIRKQVQIYMAKISW